MYSAMVVDDEPLMLKYLKNNVGRIAPEWQVSGIASDGLQAVELLQRQSFDLVITDIRMPEMDGLELTKFIREIYPQTKVVIISGFDDFDYARRAIRCGVSDYLLKPLSDDNISETLKKIAERIHAAQTKSSSENILAKAEVLPDDELRSLFLSSAIKKDSTSIKSIYSVMSGRKMELLRQPYSCVAILGVDCAALLTGGKSYQEIASYQMRLNQLCRQYCQADSTSAACYCEDDKTAFLLGRQGKDMVLKAAESVYESIRSRMERDYSVRITGAYGTVQKDILCVESSYEIASQIFMLSFFAETPLVSPEDLHEKREFVNSIIALLPPIYYDYISNNDSRLHAELTDFFKQLPEGENSLLAIRFGIYLLNRIASWGKIKKSRLEKTFQQLVPIWKDLYRRAGSQEEMAEIFYKAILFLNKDELFQNTDDNNQLVNRAKKYIYSHYSEPISLTLVAEKLGVSASYLSDLFHREVGEPYSKFITRVRMEQAIKRMKADPNKKIYTLAAEVGFINSKHFNSVFKKFYHMTPTEYFKSFL